jgi:hypothetical protein
MFFTSLDAMFVQPQENGLSYVIDQQSHRAIAPHLEWGWGFRLGFGYGLPRDDWDVTLTWVHLPIQNDHEKTGQLTPLWSTIPILPGQFTEMGHMHWRLHLGLVDLELQKPWHLTPQFQLTPRFGVRFASIREKYFLTYEGGTLLPDQQNTVHMKNKFWGVGPIVGLDSQWTIWKRWSLFGKSDVSLTFGHLYIHQAEHVHPSEDSLMKFFKIHPMDGALAHLALGLKWAGDHLSAYLQWEQFFFLGQNQMVQFPFAPSNKMVSNLGDISLAGVSLGATYRF